MKYYFILLVFFFACAGETKEVIQIPKNSNTSYGYVHHYSKNTTAVGYSHFSTNSREETACYFPTKGDTIINEGDTIIFLHK